MTHITIEKAKLKSALEALEGLYISSFTMTDSPISIAITAIKAALTQPAQEPVGVFCEDDDIGYVRLIPHQQMKLKAWDKLYTTPQQRPWVGLTDEDKETLILKHAPPLHPDYKDDSLHGLLQAANDFLRELNT
jgi:hypothetical protein